MINKFLFQNQFDTKKMLKKGEFKTKEKLKN